MQMDFYNSNVLHVIINQKKKKIIITGQMRILLGHKGLHRLKLLITSCNIAKNHATESIT